MAPPKRPRGRHPRKDPGLASSSHTDTDAIIASVIATTGGQPGEPDAGMSEPMRTASSDLVGWATLDELAHRPDNPRWKGAYDPATDPELAAFGATVDTYGVVQAVTVVSAEAWLGHHPDKPLSPPGARWVVMMGNRRLAIARHRALDGLPYFRNDKLAEPGVSREAPIIENYHRAPLDPIREAAEMAAAMADRQDAGAEESRRALAERLGISHTQVNQRLKLLTLMSEFQGMVSDQTLAVQHAIKIAGLKKTEQRRLLALGPPYRASRLQASEPEGGKTLSTLNRAVTIKKDSTPDQVVETLRKAIPADLLKEIARLLRTQRKADQ